MNWKSISKLLATIAGTVIVIVLFCGFVYLAHISQILSWVNDDQAKAQITQDITERYGADTEIQYISSTGVIYFGIIYQGWNEDVNYQYKVTLEDGTKKTLGYTCYKNWPNPQFCSLWDAGGQ